MADKNKSGVVSEIPSGVDVARKAALVGAGVGALLSSAPVLLSGSLPISARLQLAIPVALAGSIAGAATGTLAGASGVGLHKIIAKILGNKIKKKDASISDILSYAALGTATNTLVPAAMIPTIVGNLIPHGD